MKTTFHDRAAMRNPWVAGLMSLALPGWGQLYNGEANRAIWCFLIFAFVLLPGTALFSLALPPMLMLPALVLGSLGSLGLWLYGAVDAFRFARRLVAFEPRPWQTPGLYVLVFVICAVGLLPAATLALRGHVVQPFRIASASMAPSLLPGDFVFADMHYNCVGCRPVERGDVAVFIDPNDRTRYYVKRIVALPGDRIGVRNHGLRINGVALAAAPPAADGTQVEHWGERSWRVQAPAALDDTGADEIVAPGRVFVLGDQRSASVDSRQFGTVPLADVAGRVRQIWFSHGEGAMRWSRIGERVH